MTINACCPEIETALQPLLNELVVLFTTKELYRGFLWLSGRHKVGKSTICALLVKELLASGTRNDQPKNISPQDAVIATAVVFAKKGLTLMDIICEWAGQLISYPGIVGDVFIKHLTNRCEDIYKWKSCSKDAKDVPTDLTFLDSFTATLELFQLLLVEPLQLLAKHREGGSLPLILLVLDGLDELGAVEETNFLTLLCANQFDSRFAYFSALPKMVYLFVSSSKSPVPPLQHSWSPSFIPFEVQ